MRALIVQTGRLISPFDEAPSRATYAGTTMGQAVRDALTRRGMDVVEIGPDAPLPALDAATRETLLRQVYADTKLPDKPRNVLGLAKDIPVAQMEALLRKAAPVNEDTVRQLALDRGIAVRDALLARGLPSERLFLAAPRPHAQIGRAHV